ncbi:hypothetical protein ACSMXN_09055 [Jatrophihabitans sp. DSM 45814]
MIIASDGDIGLGRVVFALSNAQLSELKPGGGVAADQAGRI